MSDGVATEAGRALPLTAKEVELYREGLRDAPTFPSEPPTDIDHMTLARLTIAEWADRCRRLLATLDAGHAEAVENERRRLYEAVERLPSRDDVDWADDEGPFQPYVSLRAVLARLAPPAEKEQT